MLTNLRTSTCWPRHMSFSEWNSIESTESIEFVEDYFLVIFIFKITKNNILQNL